MCIDRGYRAGEAAAPPPINEEQKAKTAEADARAMEKAVANYMKGKGMAVSKPYASKMSEHKN